MLEKIPPSDISVERQIIGAILLDPPILDRVANKLHPEDFYADAHQKLFNHLVALSESRRRIDTTLLIDHLKREGDLEAIGGPAYIAECAQSTPFAANAIYHSDIVLRHSLSRQVIAAGTTIVRAGWDNSPEDAIADAEQALASIKTGNVDRDPVSMQQAVQEAAQRIDEQLERHQGAGILTGLEEFDKTIGGFFPGELAIIGARPSQGKTSLALQCAAHAAERFRRVYFATLEMDRISLATKRLCSMAGVSQHSIRTGEITPHDQKQLVQAMPDVPASMWLHDWPEIRPYDIARAARQLNAEAIFVDYLQYVTPPDEKKKRYEQVGDISRQLKTIARELDIPVVACAQIGRQADQIKEGRPRLSHLRESGNIENDADMVLLLWRPEKGIETNDDQAEDKWDAEIEVAKNRLGQTGKFRLDWDASRTLFSHHGTLTHAEFDDYNQG